jgi:hypothetical protein
MDPKYSIALTRRFISLFCGWWHRKEFKEIKGYLMFIGYPRSGHSLIGSLFDAHPNIITSHELDALYYFQHGFTPAQIYFLIFKNSLDFTNSGRQWMGYNYQVPNQWHGKYTQIKMIGDKSGSRSTRRLRKKNGAELITKLKKQIGIPLFIFHVIRNPFDNITTMVRRTHERNGEEVNQQLLELQIKQYFKLVTINNRLRNDKNIQVIDIHFENFVSDPKAALRKLFEMFDLSFDKSYLEDCVSIVWKKPKQTRHSLDLWTPAIIQQVEEKLKEIDFLKHYRFQEPYEG